MQTWIAGIDRLGEGDPNVDRGYRPPLRGRSRRGSHSRTASASSIQPWIRVVDCLGHVDPDVDRGHRDARPPRSTSDVSIPAAYRGKIPSRRSAAYEAVPTSGSARSVV